MRVFQVTQDAIGRQQQDVPFLAQGIRQGRADWLSSVPSARVIMCCAVECFASSTVMMPRRTCSITSEWSSVSCSRVRRAAGKCGCRLLGRWCVKRPSSKRAATRSGAHCRRSAMPFSVLQDGFPLALLTASESNCAPSGASIERERSRPSARCRGSTTAPSPPQFCWRFRPPHGLPCHRTQ